MMDSRIQLKPIQWIGSSLDDLKEMESEVISDIGYALYQAQRGGKSLDAKVMKGFGGGVLEVIENYRGDTFRAVYTVRFEEAIYVLHVFQKKSKSGIATPKKELDLIEARLQVARQRHEFWQRQKSN